MVRFHQLIWGVTFAPVLACAQATPEKIEKNRLTLEIQSIVDTAPAAPPELAADVIIGVVDSGKVTDRRQKIELLEESFRLAPAAKYPMKIKGATRVGYSTDTSVGVLVAALNPGLDTLSLRCRAIRRMIRLDRRKALELFREIPQPSPPPLECKDAAVYSLGDYYTTLKEVFAESFSPRERNEGKDLDLLEFHARSITSPLQLYEFGRLLLDLKLETMQLRPLVSSYSAAMKQMAADPRSFAAATNPGLCQMLLQLIQMLQRQDVSPFPLIDAFRAFLTRHVAGTLCAESVDPKGEGAVLARVIDLFNKDLRSFGGGAIPAITAEEYKPAKLGGEARVRAFWEKPETKKFLLGLKQLRFGTEEQQTANRQRPPRTDGLANFLTIEQRRDPEWEAAARQYLSDLDEWKKDFDETESNYFHQRCFIYAGVLEMAPPGSLRELVLASYLSFLGQSPLKRESPPEWRLQARRLLRLTDATPDDNVRIREAMKNSSDPVLSLYADLERLAPAKR